MNIDLWWLPLIVLGAVFAIRLLLAPYWIYKDSQTQIADLKTSLSQAETERDEVLDTEQSLVLTPHTYAIGLSGMTGYPDEPDNAEWLCLEVTVHPSSKPIDTLDLLIGSETIPANDWPGKNVAAFSVYFRVTGWKWKGIIQVELQAHIQGAVHSSGRIPIDFNVEHGGSHRI